MKNLHAQRSVKGFSLIMVLVTVGICFLLLTGVLLWSSNSGQRSLRQSEYYATLAAAEAATEKALARILDDFRSGGRTQVENNLVSYTYDVPSPVEHAVWGDYDFLDSSGTPSRLDVGRTSEWEYGPLDWRDGTLSGRSCTYGILATARNRVSGNNVQAAVRQELQVAAIPLSAFFMFSGLDLELNPGSGNWLANGPVHANANLYCSPSVPVTFQTFVTAAGEILHERAPGDPLAPGGGTITYQQGKESQTGAFRTSIQDLPSDPTNLWTLCRSEADLRIEVLSSSNLLAYNAINDPVPSFHVWPFVRTTNSAPPNDPLEFRDTRENDTGEVTYVTQFDMAAFISELSGLRDHMVGAQDPRTIYIVDRRVPNAYATYMSIKLVNARYLPTGGLTLATPNPLYVQGDFNAPNLNSTNGAQPACLIADAVTVLSSAWTNANGSLPVGGRPAEDTTVNASVVTGIVPTREGNYSGGMENCLRLLEDWNGDHLYFNGSLAVLFISQIADGEWGRPDVYVPPFRVFLFAPCTGGTPLTTNLSMGLQTLFRSGWAAAAPGSTL